jgi:hypothetical protein
MEPGMPPKKRPAFNTRFKYARGHKRDGTSVLIINEHFKASSDLLVMCSGSGGADFPGASGHLARDLCNAIVPDEDQGTLSDAARSAHASEEAMNMAQKVVLRGVQELDTQNLLTGINTSLLALRLHSGEGGEMFVDSYEIGGIRWALLQMQQHDELEYRVTYLPAGNSEHAKSRLNKLNLVASHMKSQGYVLERQRLTPKSLVVAGTGLCVRACVIDLVIFVCASVCVCMRVL